PLTVLPEQTATFALTDGLGETGSATTAIHLIDDAPVGGFDVIETNADPGTSIVIPDWALLANDQDVNGQSLKIIDVDTVDGGTAVHGNHEVTFTLDSSGVGGAFSYVVSDGIDVASTGAGINQAAGLPIVFGTPRQEILIGGDGNDTIDGKGGN